MTIHNIYQRSPTFLSTPPPTPYFHHSPTHTRINTTLAILIINNPAANAGKRGGIYNIYDTQAIYNTTLSTVL